MPVNSAATSNCQKERMANAENMTANALTIFTRGSSRCITECAGPLEDTAGSVTVAVTGPPDAGAAIGIRTTRSAICSASSRSWVMMSTVTPRDLSVRNSSWIRFLAWASRLAVGSSMMSTSGLQASTPAMAANRVARRTGRRGSGRQDARYAAVPVIRARGRLPRSRQALGCVGRTPRPRLPCQRTADALDAAST